MCCFPVKLESPKMQVLIYIIPRAKGTYGKGKRLFERGGRYGSPRQKGKNMNSKKVKYTINGTPAYSLLSRADYQHLRILIQRYGYTPDEAYKHLHEPRKSWSRHLINGRSIYDIYSKSKAGNIAGYIKYYRRKGQNITAEEAIKALQFVADRKARIAEITDRAKARKEFHNFSMTLWHGKPLYLIFRDRKLKALVRKYMNNYNCRPSEALFIARKLARKGKLWQ